MRLVDDTMVNLVEMSGETSVVTETRITETAMDG